MSSEPRDEVNSPLICPACGSRSHRARAQFCITCGRTLNDLAYLPADSLRASYHLQQLQNDPIVGSMRGTKKIPSDVNPNSEIMKDKTSATTIAFVTYALVPYLGILFCPGAILMGGIGLVRSWRLQSLVGRRASYAGVVFGAMILGAQVFLWWILYKVPQWATGVEF